jgi:hypothetical protein
MGERIHDDIERRSMIDPFRERDEEVQQYRG